MRSCTTFELRLEILHDRYSLSVRINGSIFEFMPIIEMIVQLDACLATIPLRVTPTLRADGSAHHGGG